MTLQNSILCSGFQIVTNGKSSREATIKRCKLTSVLNPARYKLPYNRNFIRWPDRRLRNPRTMRIYNRASGNGSSSGVAVSENGRRPSSVNVPTSSKAAISSFGPIQAAVDVLRRATVLVLIRLLPAFATLAGGLMLAIIAIVAGQQAVMRSSNIFHNSYLTTRVPEATVKWTKNRRGHQVMDVKISRPLLACVLVCIPATVAMKVVEATVTPLVVRAMKKLKSHEEESLEFVQSAQGLESKVDLDSLETPFRGADAETVDWMNTALSKMWQLYRPNWEAEMAVSLDKTLQEMDLPFLVSRVSVGALSLSNRPMWIQSMKPLASRSNENLQMIARVRYSGLTRFKVLVELNLGLTKRILPVWIQDIDLEARMWFSYKLDPAETGVVGPVLHSLDWAFTELPRLKISIVPLKVNLNQVPLVKTWLNDLLTKELPREFLLPNKNHIPLIVDTKTEAKEEAALIEARTAWNQRPPDRDLKRVLEIESKVNPPSVSDLPLERLHMYEGMLKLTLMEVSDVPFKTHDLSCILNLDRYILVSKRDSQTSARGTKGHAVWRQHFEFPIPDTREEEPCQLSIRVVDRTPTGNVHIGQALFNVSDLEDGVRQDLTLTIQAPVRSKHAKDHEDDDLIDKVGDSLKSKRKSVSTGLVRVRLVYKKFVDEQF